jgi:hypothetical protein
MRLKSLEFNAPHTAKQVARDRSRNASISRYGREHVCESPFSPLIPMLRYRRERSPQHFPLP